jgi:hypothetical protein
MMDNEKYETASNTVRMAPTNITIARIFWPTLKLFNIPDPLNYGLTPQQRFFD